MSEFRMGATITLRDMASATFGTIRKATDLFKTSITSASQATGTFKNQTTQASAAATHMQQTTNAASNAAAKLNTATSQTAGNANKFTAAMKGANTATGTFKTSTAGAAAATTNLSSTAKNASNAVNGLKTSEGQVASGAKQMGASMTSASTAANRMGSNARLAATGTSEFNTASMRATPATNAFKNAATQTGAALVKMGGSTKKTSQEVSGLTGKLNQAKTAALGLKQGIQAFLALQSVKAGYNWLVGANANMEQYKNTLTVVLGDATKATNTLAWAQNFAAKTPFEIPEIVEATTRLSAYGMNAQKVLGVTGDMASVMGKPLMQAVEAVADAQTGELERLKEFGITKKMLTDQAKSLGTNPVNNKGQITDQAAFNAALFSLMEKRFKGGMEMQSQTFKGMLSNAADFMGTMGRQLGQPLFDKAKAGLGSLLTVLNNLQANGSIDRFVNKVHSLAAPISYVTSSIRSYLSDMSGFFRLTFSNLVTENAPKINNIVNTFSNGFTKIRPIVETAFHTLAYTIIPQVVTVLGQIITKATDVVNFFASTWPTMKPFIEGVAIAVIAYTGYVRAVELATKAWELAQIALNAVMLIGISTTGLVVLGIGLLIGAGIALYQNWDTVSAKAESMWTNMKNYFIDGTNSCIDAINKLISVINMIPGVDAIPKIDNIGRAATSETQARLDYVEMRKADAKKAAAKPNGQHKNGLDYVPFDGYRAVLHKGEMVLTAQQSEVYRKNEGFKPVVATGQPAIRVAGPAVNTTPVTPKVTAAIPNMVQPTPNIVNNIPSLEVPKPKVTAAIPNMVQPTPNIVNNIPSIEVPKPKATTAVSVRTLDILNSILNTLTTISTGIKEKTVAASSKVKELTHIKENPFIVVNKSIANNTNQVNSTMQNYSNATSQFTHNAVNNDNSSYTNVTAEKVNPAGNVETHKTEKSIVIQKIVEKLEIHGTKDMDETLLANKVIDKLYDLLKNAADIAGTSDMGALL